MKCKFILFLLLKVRIMKLENIGSGQKKIVINITLRMLIKRLFFFILPASIFLMLFVNYFIDADNIYYQQYERKMARSILEGNNVTNIRSYNDRIFQKYLIENISESPEIIVLGSPRVMMINNCYFGNYTFFNHSLNGATIEDIVTLIMLYDKRDMLPTNIIIGIEPWMLNKNNGQNRWKYLAQEYNDGLKKLNIETVSIDTSYLQKKNNKLLSPSYFFASLKKEPKLQKGMSTTKRKFNTKTTKLRDGSIAYGKIYREASDGSIEKNANKFLTRKKYGFEGNKDFYQKNMDDFDVLIDYLVSKNISITFFFTPYHPKAYEFFSKKRKYRNFTEVEKYFKAIAKGKNIQSVGSYNPIMLNMDSSYFFDGQHGNEKCFNDLVENVNY